MLLIGHKRYLPMRARSSTGWTSGAATYDSGLTAHTLNRPAPRCSALLSGLVEVNSHLVPSPVANSRSASAPLVHGLDSANPPSVRSLQHNHARYDVFGHLAAEYDPGATVTPACQTCYLTYDHLGSVRMVTDQRGDLISRHDYAPFGQEIYNAAGRSTPFGNSDGVSQRFTGKERDGDTTPNLDFFGARYYGSALGRFPSPDDPLVDQDPSDPQSWNLYGYVRNNPLRNIDQTGRSCITLDNGSQADNGDGQGCSGAGVSAGNPNDASTLNQGQVNAQVTAQQGSWLAAVGTNAFLSASNAANSFFSFIAPDSQLLSQTPTGSGAAANIGAGIGLAATFIGPGGETEEAAQGASRLWSKGVKNAFQHWIKHGKEFPNLQNAKQYVEAAQEFVTNPPPGTLSKLRPNGDTVLYSPSTNTFAVKTADGVPRTMFKPNNGMTYFNAQ